MNNNDLVVDYDDRREKQGRGEKRGSPMTGRSYARHNQDLCIRIIIEEKSFREWDETVSDVAEILLARAIISDVVRRLYHCIQISRCILARPMKFVYCTGRIDVLPTIYRAIVLVTFARIFRLRDASHSLCFGPAATPALVALKTELNENMTFNMSPVVFKICAVALLTQLRISPGYAQSDSIVFAGTATTVATTQTPTTRASSNCRCVTAGTCGSAGVDVRIVNQGAAGCPYGQEWCCGSTTAPPTPPPPSTSCGIRKITNSAAQPEGTAKYGAYPWQAALLTESNAYIGSGVLISPDYVLTAAHKTAMYPNRNFIVRLGEWDGQKTNEPNAYQDYTPAQVITHPNYNSGNYQNDISIIRLNKSVPIASSPNINTACLASAVPAAGTRCWVSGWGKNAFGSSGSYQSIMREVDVPIIDQADCESRLRNTRLGQYFVLDRTSYMCAGGEAGKDACTGDGGAPLVCQQSNGQWQVVGLVTWGIGCASSGVPGVYVNVPNYRSWITQLTGVSR